MARTKKPNNSRSNVVPMNPEPAGNVAVAEPEPETPFDSPPTAPETPVRPAPPAPTAPPPKPKGSPTFFQRVASIPKADWGTRAFIYVYCLQPICDLRQGGETKYLVKYTQPLEDENLIMIDYGSGRYRLQLVHRKPAADKSDAIDTTEIEIYNPKYPPLIPREVWMNDPRNKRWEALLPPKEAPAPPPAAGIASVTEAFDTFTKIRKDMREEIAPPPAPQSPPAQPATTMSDTLNLVDKIMSMKADNPMSDIYRDELKAMRDEIRAEREENRKLQREMREAAEKRAESKSDGNGDFESWVDKIEKIAPKLQGLLGLGGEKVTDIVHGRRREWWQELLISAAPQVAPGLNAMMGAAANYFLMPKGGLGGAPQANPGQQALPGPTNGQPPQPDSLHPLRVKVGRFLESNLMPMQKAFEDFMKKKPRDPEDAEQGYLDGSDFAAWVAEYHGPQILQDARSLGSANIVEMFKAAPAIWAAIAPKEVQFRQFLDQVLAFTPDEVEESEEGKPVDLTEE